LSNNKENGFTLLEVLISLGILAFVLSSSLKLFSTNSFSVQKLEEKTMANFVAQNILVKSFLEENLVYEEGFSIQGNRKFQWQRDINILDEGESAEILVKVINEENNIVYELSGIRFLE
tara:strand:+ start:212 stop:568 length:357 start_codon:yes stop_codon:yes gene_type:complete